MRTSLVGWVVMLGLAGGLLACSGVPVPADKKDYVGQWEGVGMTLTITADGGVAYKRVSGGGNREINAPIQRFVGADFEVGALGFSTTFKVDKPPFQDGEQWKMTVDGTELTRVR